MSLCAAGSRDIAPHPSADDVAFVAKISANNDRVIGDLSLPLLTRLVRVVL